MIKNTLKIASLLVLSFTLVACGDICEEDVKVVFTPTTVVVSEPTVVAPPVIEPPKPVGLPPCGNNIFVNCLPPDGFEICDLKSYIPCATPVWIPKPPKPIVVCPESTSVGIVCPISPYPVPLVPVVILPEPEPVCIRNEEPLAYVEPFWVDNCGAKYGATKV